jgi:hypothetical protein
LCARDLWRRIFAEARRLASATIYGSRTFLLHSHDLILAKLLKAPCNIICAHAAPWPEAPALRTFACNCIHRK